MKEFDELLAEDIAGYEGRHDDVIYQAPALYRLLCRFLDDPALPRRLRPLVLSAIAYFVLPADVIPEDIYGPEGYLDDIWLACHVAAIVRKEVGDDHIVHDNWDGEAEPAALIEEVCTTDFVDKETKEAVLGYIDLP